MLTVPVPDFFQDESEPALRSRLEWLGQQLLLGDSFFARCLGVDEVRFRAWQEGRASLSDEEQAQGQECWRVLQHLFAFTNYEEQRVRGLLEHPVPEGPATGSYPFAPPWRGSSLKAYLEAQGPAGLPEVERWVTAFRFGNPYLT